VKSPIKRIAVNDIGMDDDLEDMPSEDVFQKTVSKIVEKAEQGKKNGKKLLSKIPEAEEEFVRTIESHDSSKSRIL